MSLATDILRGGNISPPSKRKPSASYIELSARAKAKRARVESGIPGVRYVKQVKRWEAYFYNGNTLLRLGQFDTQERAHIALRILRHWRKRGFDCLPHKPNKRGYVRRA